VLPAANSFGLSLLKPKDLAMLPLNQPELIVLENNLPEAILKQFSNIIAIDFLETETTRDTVTWPKPILININLPTTLITKFKAKQASNKDIQWENFQVNKHNKNSLISPRQTFNTSQSIKMRTIIEDSKKINFPLPNSFRTKTNTTPVTICKKIMIIISNMIKTIISNSISKISKVNRTSNKILRTLMGDSKLKSNLLLNLMKDFKLNSMSLLYNNLIKSNKNIMNKT
jgi:hypothetical protein